jgi:uncharacterized protein (UPF0261 family)
MDPTVNSAAPRILLIGTGDTKSDEIIFMRDTIDAQGGTTLIMDVSVLGQPKFKPDFTKHQVAEAAQSSINAIVGSGDENSAMAVMAKGAALLALQLCTQKRIDGVLILGGTMGTDLALDVANVLPLGLPKFVVSTVAFSHLIQPERIPPDLMMILWAGGLFGLNEICKSSLAQACGAVVGAARAQRHVSSKKPVVGMTSLSILKYMWLIKPELEKRGFELAVFHSTGMGGRAFESVASQGGFACVMDFCLQEVVNHEHGIIATSSGTSRLECAGQHGVPQIVAPGAIDMVDIPSWAPVPDKWKDRPYHAHNRIVGSIITTPGERRASARNIAAKLSRSKSPVAFILPNGGIQEWDREGAPLHDPVGLGAFCDEIRKSIMPPIQLHDIADHINSQAFAAKAMEIFDHWLADGVILPD